jgi:hypothetical protein
MGWDGVNALALAQIPDLLQKQLQQQHKHTVSMMSACLQRSEICNNSTNGCSRNSSITVGSAASKRC